MEEAIPGREVELKLLVAPADLPRIGLLPEILAMADGPAVKQRLHTSYYDTPALELAARGVALRLRRQNGHRVQSLKTLGADTAGDAAGIAMRREWEWEITGDRPDLSLLAEGELARVFPADLADRLDPVFATDMQRTTLLLRPEPGIAVELALDLGQAVAQPPGKASTHRPISEMELELKSGRLVDLFRLAAVVHRKVPLRLSTRSKADLGFSLLTGESPKASPARPLGLTPVTTVAEAFRHMGRNGLAQLLDNEPALMAASDPAALREVAAALRRIEAAFALFKGVVASPRGDGLRQEMRELGQPIERARAWDRVAIRVMEPRQRGRQTPRVLSAAVAGARRAARMEAVERLNSPAGRHGCWSSAPGWRVATGTRKGSPACSPAPWRRWPPACWTTGWTRWPRPPRRWPPERMRGASCGSVPSACATPWTIAGPSGRWRRSAPCWQPWRRCGPS
ncbi:CYTH and CHAD domain-containing protein [Aerophototrophica crusticola]|uniref:CYTH and CHAD domain-containing protein n=1 Tax=Aerophototrophica crusticola TaxID=1709002 RepID=A0A858R6P9_9PROT|nr:CYTH and CHAD domain-containing protein [Rhodospirillaceae bacterium B3]